MSIYISHSTGYNFREDLYIPLKKIGADFIFPHDTDTNQYPTKELFSSKKCSLVIAEVSFPSTGQGIELGWANDANIPIICIYRAGSKYSGSLNVVSEKFLEYSDAVDLIEKVKQII